MPPLAEKLPATSNRPAFQPQLDIHTLPCKVARMDNHWAAEHLQTIRTLMERSALYRRALAPIMTFAGAVGTAAAALGWFLKLESPRAFTLFWLAVCLIGLAGTLLLVRRQALKEAEPFWSLPTRRIAQAVLPALFVGAMAGVIFLVWVEDAGATAALPIIWILLYGCALHAAAVFTPRGLKLLGWLFILGGCGLVFGSFALENAPETGTGHWLMGAFFGLLQLAYGIYLYFTEKDGSAA